MKSGQINEFKNTFIKTLSQAEDSSPEKFKQFFVENQGDEIDLLNAEKEGQMGMRLQSRNNIYLKKIKNSLDKIHEGTFGICEDCGCEISLTRLQARPTAELCILCKEEEEMIENQLVHKNRHSLKWQSQGSLNLVSNS